MENLRYADYSMSGGQMSYAEFQRTVEFYKGNFTETRVSRMKSLQAGKEIIEHGLPISRLDLKGIAMYAALSRIVDGSRTPHWKANEVVKLLGRPRNISDAVQQ